MTERVVLAYSGGLDTSVAIGWIAEQTGAEVIAVAVDVGQGGEDLEVIRQRALDCGAVEAVRGRRPRRVRRRVLPAGAPGQRALHGPLPAGLGAVPAADRQAPGRRPPASTAAPTVAHGCTGKGNDQVRFEVGIAALAPDLTVHRPGPRPRADPRQGDRVRRGARACRSRRPRSRRTRSTRTSGAAPSRPASSRTSGTAPIEDVYAYTAEPGDAARAGRGRHHLRAGRPGGDRRRAGHLARGDPAAQRPRRRAGRRPARHGRGPARRHQEPRGLRGARRDRADHRAPGARERHRRARARPVQARRRAALGRAGLRRAVVLAAEARPRRFIDETPEARHRRRSG